LSSLVYLYLVLASENRRKGCNIPFIRSLVLGKERSRLWDWWWGGTKDIRLVKITSGTGGGGPEGELAGRGSPGKTAVKQQS